MEDDTKVQVSRTREDGTAEILYETGLREGDLMYEREYITIDPLGDMHVQKVSVLEGGNWHHRSYQDKYYPLGRYRRTSYRDEPELLHTG